MGRLEFMKELIHWLRRWKYKLVKLLLFERKRKKQTRKSLSKGTEKRIHTDGKLNYLQCISSSSSFDLVPLCRRVGLLVSYHLSIYINQTMRACVCVCVWSESTARVLNQFQ